MSPDLSGVSAVIWLEGINDLSGGTKADAVIAGMREIVRRSRARGLKIFGATIVPSLGSATAHGTPEVDAERQAINAFIRSAGAFDGVVDFDLATRDPADRRTARGLSAQQHDWRPWRSAAPEPGGLSSDGERRRPPTYSRRSLASADSETLGRGACAGVRVPPRSTIGG